ncbi:hypothetical protein FRC12_000781, partial [Ceratobasidium sp. 428]
TSSFQGQLVYRNKADLTGKTITAHFHIHESLILVEIDDSRQNNSSAAVAIPPAGHCTNLTARNYQFYMIWEDL